jgi:hypothetical protein
VGSNPERSSLSGTRRLGHAEVTSGKRRASPELKPCPERKPNGSNALLACSFRQLAESASAPRNGECDSLKATLHPPRNPVPLQPFSGSTI